MASVDLRLPHHHYEIRIEPGLLARLGELVRSVAPHDCAALLSDAAVDGHYGKTVRATLADAGFQVVHHTVPSGENHKNLETVRRLHDILLTARLERRSPVLALGGGVIGDTVGFVASTYLRGVPFVQCPTSLLAMVDASVGGKVGVNVPQGKNLIGSFYQPHLVAIDTETLSTLPPRELRCGLAECVKHGVIRDADLFDWIDRRLDAILTLDTDTLVELVERNVRIKAAVVMADEKESGQRAHLNFGHTFAHAIEATGGYRGFHHGEAVALGMVAAAGVAVDTGRCGAEVQSQLTRLLDRIGLPTSCTDLAPTPQLIETMRMDKKVADGRIRLVLPDRLGNVSVVADVPEKAIAAAWGALKEGGGRGKREERGAKSGE